MKLQGVCQNYAWGKKGMTGLVGQLYGCGDDQKPQAEFWMSTHPSGHSKINGMFLSDFLKSQSENILGIEGYTTELPFLLKVLSVETALSIQAHPDKTLGKLLFEKDPKNYRDPNHKPEICIALGRFEAFAGFMNMSKISGLLDSVKEWRNLVGEEAAKEFQQNMNRESLKKLFSVWMTADPERIKKELRSLIDRVGKEKDLKDVNAFELLVLRLSKDYPDDVGCFAPFMLNYTVLEEGESLFLGPNEPHAYIYGDCIECMSCSDNVIRAGLTPKFRDTQVLIEMLSYDDCGLENSMKLKTTVYNECINLYIPPVDEFAVCRIKLNGQKTNLVLPCASIFIVIDGSGSVLIENSEKSSSDLKKGDIYFSPKETKFEFSSSEKMLVFVASYNKF